jgi:hypothetical protein
MRRTRIFCLITLLAFLNAGCYQGYQVLLPGKNTTDFTAVTPSLSKPPVFYSGSDYTLTGYGRVERPEWKALIDSELDHQLSLSGAFGGITTTRPLQPHLALKLTNQTIFSDSGKTNESNAFLLSISFFILSPILKFRNLIESHYQLEATWPDGERKNYREVCTAEYHGNFYSRTVEVEKAFRDLNASCVKSLVHSLINGAPIHPKPSSESAR